MTTKQRSLEQHGSLNRRPKAVRAPLFAEHDFFDPEDLVQVKYEMLRQVRVDGEAVSVAAARFGFSRPSFYAARERFESEGLMGIVPRRSGPHEGHKLSEEVVDFLEKVLAENPSTRPSQLVSRVQKQFGLHVHARSIERALNRRRKKTQAGGDHESLADLTQAYETLRENRLSRLGEATSGLAIFLQQGMLAWMEICSAVLPVAAIPIRQENDMLPAEVVTVMAQMVWACFEEIHS